MSDNTQDQTNKVNTMSRTEMDKNLAFASFPTGIVMGEEGFPLLNEKGEQQFLDLSDEEIISDFKQELKRLFVKDEGDEYITDNDLVSVREGYGYGKYMSVDGYIDSAEQKLGAEFGVIENYLHSVIKPLDEEYEKNVIYRIDEPNKPLENYIEKQIRLYFGEYIDPDGYIEVDGEGAIPLHRLIEMTKERVKVGFKDRAEILNEDADFVNERYPIKQDIEVPLSQNPEEWIDWLNSEEASKDKKNNLYLDIQSSARHSERNMVSRAILPVVHSLVSEEIQTSQNVEFQTQLKDALDIVNNDLLVGAIPDYVKTAVLSMRAASKLRESIKEVEPYEEQMQRQLGLPEDDITSVSFSKISSWLSNHSMKDELKYEFDSLLNDDPDFNYDENEFLEWVYDQHMSVESSLTPQRKSAIVNLNLNHYFEPYKIDSEGNIEEDESGIPIFKTEDDILDELRDVDFGDNYVSDSYDESSVLISEIDLDSNGLPNYIVTSTNINLEYHFPATMSYEDIEVELENIELPSNYVEDTYDLETIVIEDGAPTLTHTDPEVSSLIQESTKTVTAHVNLGYYYDPSMTKDEVEADLENIELPTGYKPNSFKFKKLKDNGVDSNGVQNEKMAICSIEMDFVFPTDTPYEELRRDIELICGNSIPGEYKITELDGVNQPQTRQTSSFDIEADFEDPWHEYHIATRPTEDQLLSARVALKSLKINAAKNDTDSLIALASIYESGVRGEFKKELFDYSEYCKRERMDFKAYLNYGAIGEGDGRDFGVEITNEKDDTVEFEFYSTEDKALERVQQINTTEEVSGDNEQDHNLDLLKEGYEKYLSQITSEDRMKISESLLKQASKDNNEQAKLKFLNTRYERAKELEQNDFYNSQEVFDIFLENAESGHVPSMLSVAEKYRVGHGVDSSAVEHEKWYLQAKKGLDSGKVIHNRPSPKSPSRKSRDSKNSTNEI